MSHTFEPILILIYGVDQVNILSTCCSLFLKELRVFFEWASLVAQMVKNLPAIWEIRVNQLNNASSLTSMKSTYKLASLQLKGESCFPHIYFQLSGSDSLLVFGCERGEKNKET